MAGWVVTRQVTSNLQIGAELFHQSASEVAPATTSVGVGAIYDVNKNVHLLGYLRTGVQNPQQTDGIAWYTAVLFTF